MATIAQINADLVGSSATALAGILANQQAATQLLTSILQEVTASKVANATGKLSEAAGAGAPAGGDKAKDDKKDKKEAETKNPPKPGDIFSKDVLMDATDKYRSGIDVAKAYSDMFGKMETSLIKFVDTGKFSFRDFTKSIIDDLVKIEMKILLSRVLDSIFGLPSIDVPATSEPISLSGMALEIAPLQMNIQPLSYPQRASGGPVGAGRLYEVAEGGRPELLVSGGRTYLMAGAQGGQVTPATRANVAGGGGAGVSVLIENHTDVQPQVSRSTGPNGEDVITVLMKHVDSRMTQNAANPNSSFGKAIKNTYGLQRRGVPVSGG